MQVFDTDGSAEALQKAKQAFVNPFQGQASVFHGLRQLLREKQCVVTCSMQIEGAASEEVTDEGLLCGHEYMVQAVMVLTDSTGKTHLIIKVVNPHGRGEWNGAYGDNDDIWKDPDMAKARVEQLGMSLDPADDGATCMSWEDFSTRYTRFDMLEGFEGLRSAFLETGCAKQVCGRIDAHRCGSEKNWYRNPKFLLTFEGTTKVTIALSQPNTKANPWRNPEPECICKPIMIVMMSRCWAWMSTTLPRWDSSC